MNSNTVKNRKSKNIAGDLDRAPGKAPSRTPFRAVFYPEPLPSPPPDAKADDDTANASPLPSDTSSAPNTPSDDAVPSGSTAPTKMTAEAAMLADASASHPNAHPAKHFRPANIAEKRGAEFEKVSPHTAFRAAFYPEPLPFRPPEDKEDDGSAFAMLPSPVDTWIAPSASDGDAALFDIPEPADAEAAMPDDILAQLALESERVLRDPSYRGVPRIDTSVSARPARARGDEAPHDDSVIELLTEPTHLDKMLASMGSDDYAHFLSPDDTPDVLSLFPSTTRSPRARKSAVLAQRDHLGMGLDSPYPISDATVVREATPTQATDR